MTPQTGKSAGQPAPVRNYKPTITDHDQPRPLGRDQESIKEGVIGRCKRGKGAVFGAGYAHMGLTAGR